MSVIAVGAISFDGLGSMGLCTRNLARSLWAVGLAAAIAMIAVVMAGRLHTLHTPETVESCIKHYGGYAIWAAGQQLILQCFFLPRSIRLVGNATAAAAIAAVLFAVAHLPNPLLTVVTLVCGLASCLFFLHYRNLWPLALAHAILGISIGITVPVSLDHNMYVGISYMQWAEQSPVIAGTAVTPKTQP